MRLKLQVGRCAGRIFLLGAVFFSASALAQSNINVRVMAANLTGNTQIYEPFAIRIFQGLKPDIVAIQEFNYSNNTTSDFRSMVDTAFGTNFVYYREPYTGSGDIPNGIISRYSIIASGSWTDTVMSSPNRGYAWAEIDLPGTNDIYVVSVHLLTSSAGNRAAEAANLKALMQANFPSNAWIVLAGDFNTDSRTEAAITTFSGYLSDFPIPVDDLGNSDTSVNRNHPHDYVLPSLLFTNLETATVFPTHTYPNGLVFDSRVYSDLSDFSPVQSADSGLAQHMGVVKDFLIPVSGTTNPPTTNAPSITSQPQSQAVSPGSNVIFTVTASGTAPLSYQWLFNGTNISGATTNPFTLNNAQPTNAGNYSVTVTNIAGSITSSNAVLTVSNFPPNITTQPQSQTVSVGASPTFTVVATGTAPLSYQWVLGTTNIPGANTNFYTRSNVQINDAGNYSVVVTNIAGSVTSSVATLTILVTNPVAFAQWNFNSSPADGSTTTGTTTPSTGTGTASLVGGTTSTFATGDTSLDPAGSTDNSGWNTTGYPASASGNKTAGVQFNVSTAGKQNIIVTWSQRASATGTKYARLRYSTNGTTFVDFPTAVSVSVDSAYEAKTNSLSGFAGVDNNTNFAFQIVGEFQSTATGSGSTAYIAAKSGSTYAITGTLRFDMVTVSGTGIIINSTPAAAAVLSAPKFSTGQFQMLVTGSAGSNYVVQVSTNLVTTNWISLFTNVSPFTFTDINIGTLPQKFYRAVSPP